jgi:ferritin-like protein
MIILLSTSCCILFMGCAGKSRLEIQKRLMTMSDTELINHYKMLEMRMIDIDRNREQSLKQEHDLYGRHYPGDAYNHLGHLHIADHWNALKKEKQLTQWEMRKRGLSPPQ